MNTSERILSIRAKAGNPNTVCPTCGRAPSNPFRSYDGHGNVIHGCVDAIHTGHLVTPSESARWHARGKEIRKNELNHLRSL